MKKLTRFVSIVGLCAFCNLVWADGNSGGPRADFLSNELIVPCVQIKNHGDPDIDESYYDAVFIRRGNSSNYELVSAELGDQPQCQRVDEFAIFDNDTSSEDDAARILVSCETYTNPPRSKVSVKGRKLTSDTYSSTITSGSDTTPILTKDTNGHTIKFDFDSSVEEINEGAIQIDPNFIVEGKVSAEIFAGDVLVLSVTDILCKVEDEDEDEDD